MRAFGRIYACVLALTVGGCGGAVAVEGTFGRQALERARAAHPDGFVCGGVGITPYTAGGFVLGVVPTVVLLSRFGVFRWITRTD